MKPLGCFNLSRKQTVRRLVFLAAPDLGSISQGVSQMRSAEPSKSFAANAIVARLFSRRLNSKQTRAKFMLFRYSKKSRLWANRLRAYRSYSSTTTKITACSSPACLKSAAPQLRRPNNGALGVTAAQAKPYDVILMDIQMPVMNGYEAMRKLRDIGHPSPIVALTAHAFREEREACLASGCDAYLTKPIDVSTLGFDTSGVCVRLVIHESISEVGRRTKIFVSGPA